MLLFLKHVHDMAYSNEKNVNTCVFQFVFYTQ